MLLAAVLTAAALAAQAPAPEQAPAAPTTQPAAVHEAPTGAAVSHIDAGLASFRARRFAAARAEFEKALAAEPRSAAAAFYLGYAYYKIGEPSRRMNASKQKAKELFAQAFSLDPAFVPSWGR